MLKALIRSSLKASSMGFMLSLNRQFHCRWWTAGSSLWSAILVSGVGREMCDNSDSATSLFLKWLLSKWMSELKAGGFLLSGLCHKLKVRRMTMTRQNQFDPLCNQFVLLCNVDLAIIGRVLHSFLPSWDDVGGRLRLDTVRLWSYHFLWHGSEGVNYLVCSSVFDQQTCMNTEQQSEEKVQLNN